MKVLIFPTGDRLGQSSLIQHYYKSGHDVFVPKFGSLGLNWESISQWPSLLCKDPESKKRNLKIYGLDKSKNFFGEDYFLENQEFSDNQDVPEVRICSEEEFKDTNFDIFHTLRGAENDIIHYQNLMKSKKTTWLSSTINAYNHNPGNFSPKNIVRILPASYETTRYENSNVFNMWCTDIEFDLLGISRENVKREKVLSSFNHNFHVRQPDDFKLFKEMNVILEKRGLEKVINYGGNVRGMGADIRYSKDGPVGNYETLSPIETLKKYKTLSGVVHFKQNDWGGGVFFHSLFSHTPVITTRRYIEKTNSSNYLIHNFNSLHIESPIEAANAVEKLLNDEVFEKMSSGMSYMKKKLMNEDYWSKWTEFLNTVIETSF